MRRTLAWVSFGGAILVLVSPLKLAWMRPEHGWLFPFGLWLAILVVGALVSRGPRSAPPNGGRSGAEPPESPRGDDD